MKIKSIFEKVNLIIPLEQRRFFNYLEDTASELIAKYGEKFVLEGCACDCTHDNNNSCACDCTHDNNNSCASVCIDNNISGEINILPLYEKAIVNNILFNAGAGEQYISEFIRHAEQAHLYYWRVNAIGKRLKKKEW